MSPERVGWGEGLPITKYGSFYVLLQVEFDKYLVAPCIELYNTQIAIWRAMWIMVGNKKIVKGFI